MAHLTAEETYRLHVEPLPEAEQRRLREIIDARLASSSSVTDPSRHSVTPSNGATGEDAAEAPDSNGRDRDGTRDLAWRTILDLYGAARDNPVGMDAQEYVNWLRSDAWPDPPRSDEQRSQSERHSLLELRGLGKAIWEGVDAQEYIDELRGERESAEE